MDLRTTNVTVWIVCLCQDAHYPLKHPVLFNFFFLSQPAEGAGDEATRSQGLAKYTEALVIICTTLNTLDVKGFKRTPPKPAAVENGRIPVA